MKTTTADRRSECTKTLAALDQRKGKHQYLADALARLQPAGAAVAAAEPGIGFKDADFHDSVARRTAATKEVSPLLVSVRKHATLDVAGRDAQKRAAAHYIADDNTRPRSFADQEASLKFLIGALTGHTETWATDAKTKGEGLLHDLQASTVERNATKTGTDAAHADYAKAAAEWDTAYAIAVHLVSAAALILKDPALHDAIIWTHPRHHAAEATEPAPAPAPQK